MWPSRALALLRHAKIACERLDRGIDHNAHDSAQFVSKQLENNTTDVTVWV
jgi:hypothetical protein